MKSIQRFFKVAAFAGLAVALSGCVVRPLGWGHGGHGGHGGDRRHIDSDRGHSQGSDYRRDNSRRSGH